ncbi:hypothetical protein [Pseudomarimonas salicorniae]|uniref:DUF2306 domain-containing protein n=1 Tax=Pseudomarimonas salicorniae TaxID=2933270 RepID=A0ABT0GGY7_9GAMM|nr:hypothetical protein [Lysobacter sp. CAU 1642]MCK7593474.1 hypothetical protein [Lysobacter sp. CAU 1642]
MNSYTISLVLHLASGTLALVCFWIAAFVRKGSRPHVLAGRVYMGAMLGVIVSGAPLAHALLERGHPVSALFLSFLLLLTGSACWNALRAIRDRGDRQRYFGPVYWILNASVGLGGAGMIWLGTQAGGVVLQVFGGVGLLAAAGSVQSWRRAPNDPRWWLKEHYGNIIGCGVATHIAFLGIGLRRLLPMLDGSTLTLIAWLAPLVVAVIASIRLDRRYGRPAADARVGQPSPTLPIA